MTSKQIWVALVILGVALIGYLIRPDYKILKMSDSERERAVWRVNATTGEVCMFRVDYYNRMMKKICGGNGDDFIPQAKEPAKQFKSVEELMGETPPAKQPMFNSVDELMRSTK